MNQFDAADEQRKSKLVLPIVLLLLAAIVAGVLFFALRVPIPPALPIPPQNAYDEFVRIGKLVGELPKEDDEKNAEAIGQFVSSNRELLEEVRLALKMDCVVPIEYSKDYFDSQLTDIGFVRQSARLLQYEAKHKRLLDQPNDAAGIDLELLAMSRKLGNGGFNVHRLVGIAYEKLALMNLAETASKLTSEQKKQVLQRLGAVPGKEPLELVEQRETAMGTKSVGRIRAIMTRKLSQAANEQTRAMEAEIAALEKKAYEALSE